MPILQGAIAYKTDLPNYDEFVNEWLDKSLKPDPPVVKCPKCDAAYILIEPDVEPEGTVKHDVAALREQVAGSHPDHPHCVAFRVEMDAYLAEQVERINGSRARETAPEATKDEYVPRPSEIIQQPTEEVSYPSWQPLCRAVMIEIEPEKIKEKVAVAEAAMARRWAELTTPDDDPERLAIKQERELMRLTLAEVHKQHPELVN